MKRHRRHITKHLGHFGIESSASVYVRLTHPREYIYLRMYTTSNIVSVCRLKSPSGTDLRDM